MSERFLDTISLDTIVSLAKRRGFIFPSSEIYGGLSSTWDYGPLGVELKRNVKQAWWSAVVHQRHDIVGLDTAILMHPKIWDASGHAQGFTDPLVECKTCNLRFREDNIYLGLYTSGDPTPPNVMSVSATTRDEGIQKIQDRVNDIPGYEVREETVVTLADSNLATSSKSNIIARDEVPCPSCGQKGSLTKPRLFNLMAKTFLGPVEDSASQVWLRPETAQGIFVNFQNVLTATRRKLPFGIAQIGKSFRNEITPGNFTFRTREFEQMEIEYFVQPGEDDIWLKRWVDDRMAWYTSLGIRPDHLRLRQHGQDELAHYAKDCYDIEYRFPWGWAELEGIANRTDFDLRRHAEFSKQDLSYFHQETGEHLYPYVIEPSGGVDRASLAFLIDAYDEEPSPTAAGGQETRTVLHLHPTLAPIKVAVLPLSRNSKLNSKAHEVFDLIRPHMHTQYDDAQSIGRRYRRQDEAGTPICVTIDFQTVEQDNAVTLRSRDSMDQIRVPIPDLIDSLRAKLSI